MPEIMTSSSQNTKEPIASSIKKVHHEMITSYKFTVAVLIKCYCHFKTSVEVEVLPATELVQIRKSFCLVALKILQGPDLRLNELKSLLKSHESLCQVIEKFDQNLDEIRSNGIGAVLDVIDELKVVLNDGKSLDKSLIGNNVVVARNSVIGYFLRRFIVFFEVLTFSEVTGLYESFLWYYDEWQKTAQSTLTVETRIDEWYLDEKQWSRRQAELFLATQAALLQNDEERAMSPEDLQNRISSILKSNPNLAEAHFMSFLNYLRIEEYCGAIHSLYHCFDKRANPDVKSFTDEKSKEHRYAALNLAILYHHFGHTKEALAALKEAIKIAHGANDNLCLQHALSWLYRLSNVNKDNLIVQCIIKTFELNISYTTSLALQNFAHYGSAKTSVKPSVIFETLTKSDMLNCQHNFKDLIFNNNTMKASLWRLYGKTEMCSLWSQVLLYLNIDTISQTAAYYGEGYLQAVCNTALNMLLEGKYDKVNALLEYAKYRYPNEPLSRTWMLVENWADFTRFLYHEDWREAEICAKKMVVLDKWEGYLKLAEVYFYQQEYAKSTNYLNDIFKNYNYDEHLNDGKFCLLRAKILQAEVRIASAYPNVSNAMLTLNNCLLEAEKSELAYHIALVNLHLAHLLLCLGVTTQSLKILNQPRCMIEVLANGGAYDRARATLLYTKCLIADSSKLEEEKRLDVIKHCAESLDKVKADFERVEAYTRVKDVLFLQVNLYNMLNDSEKRNNCSKEYSLLEEECTTKNIHTLLKFL